MKKIQAKRHFDLSDDQTGAALDERLVYAWIQTLKRDRTLPIFAYVECPRHVTGKVRYILDEAFYDCSITNTYGTRCSITLSWYTMDDSFTLRMVVTKDQPACDNLTNILNIGTNGQFCKSGEYQGEMMSFFVDKDELLDLAAKLPKGKCTLTGTLSDYES